MATTPQNGTMSQNSTTPQNGTMPQNAPSSAPISLRWRIHAGQIPLRRRHLRALGSLKLPEPLMGWIHERLEWAAINLLDDQTEAVLVLDIDPDCEVKVSLETLGDPPILSRDNLIETGGYLNGVEKDGQLLAGSVWLERNGVLYVSSNELISATETLAYDLAQTLQIPVEIQPQIYAQIDDSSIFLVSDEFGFVVIQDYCTDESSPTARLKKCFARLW